MDIRKNTNFNGIITDINDDGQGVLNFNGAVVFVPYTLPEETVDGIIINAKSKFYIGKALAITNHNKNRATAPCPYFSKCGGCDLQHVNYNFELEYKTNKVKQALKRNGKIETTVLPCIGLNEYRYRNKIALPLSSSGQIGLFRKNSHSVLPIEDCLITKEWNKDIIEVISDYLKQTCCPVYNEETKQGILKHVVAREINGTVLVTMIVTDENLPKIQSLINLLSAKFTSFGLNLNINKLNNNVILADKWKHVFGIKELTSFEEGITYPVSNASFYQVNNEIKNAIYNHVLSFITPSCVVIDAYSGAGLLSAIISRKAKKCYGVEIVKEATQNANKLKENNHLENLENINGDCMAIIPKLIKDLSKTEKEIIVTLDPPRKGCDKKVLSAIIDSKPNKIIYISCNPQTLARDLGIIKESGLYNITLVQPYNMFPKTSHVETLAVIEKI